MSVDGERSYVGYEDVTTPIAAALCHARHGLSIVAVCIRRTFSTTDTLSKLVPRMLSLPTRATETVQIVWETFAAS